MIRHHLYSGRTASLATRHDKWPLIGPAVERTLGMSVIEVEVDTDILGTFSGEVSRPGSPRETAILKARMGMAEAGVALGFASEGSIGPHPFLPMLVSDVELVVFVDDDLGIVVAEVESQFGIPTLTVDIEPQRWQETPVHLGGFPEHGLIVHPSRSLSPIFKGIHDLDSLRVAVEACEVHDPSSTVRIMSDLRAHHHPTRREVIARAADKLARRLVEECPQCSTPGWGVIRREGGAPCSLCGCRTREVRFEHLGCARCDVAQTLDLAPRGGVDPMHCPRCNP